MSMSLLALLSITLIVQVATVGGPVQEAAARQEPPAWVDDGVPDTVWILVDATYAETNDDRIKEMLKDAEAQARVAMVRERHRA